MNVDRHWGMWVVASLVEHFKQGDLNNVKLYLEGQARTSPASLVKLHNEWLELRVDGPTWNFHADDCFARFEINISVMVGKTDKNLWRCRELCGYCEELFADPIQIYKYGPQTDPENDKSLFDCLRRRSFRGTDNEIVTAYFGELDPKVPIEQATVESHYVLVRNRS